MGAGNYIGLKECKTNYAYVLNPDTIFHKDTFRTLIETLNNLPDFTLATPLNDDKNFPNYKKTISSLNNNSILSVDSIDGFSMLFNLKKFSIFMYFEVLWFRIFYIWIIIINC